MLNLNLRSVHDLTTFLNETINLVKLKETKWSVVLSIPFFNEYRLYQSFLMVFYLIIINFSNFFNRSFVEFSVSVFRKLFNFHFLVDWRIFFSSVVRLHRKQWEQMPLVVIFFASLSKWERRNCSKIGSYIEKATIETSFNQKHWLRKTQHKISVLKMQGSGKQAMCRFLSFKQNESIVFFRLVKYLVNRKINHFASTIKMNSTGMFRSVIVKMA